MFGLSRRELLIRTVKNACVSALPTYEERIKGFIAKTETDSEMTDEEAEKIANECRHVYLSNTYEIIRVELAEKRPLLLQKIGFAMISPSIIGLPEEIDTDYLLKNGMSAGVVYAFLYYAMTNKCIKTAKDFRSISMLNHYQTQLMNDVLQKFNR